MQGVPPFAQYVPGADTGLNDSRRQGVRAVTVHTTQGPDSRGVGQSRHHNTPGTFNFLNRDEAIYCYYPADVRCSHAAGANHAGPGCENEGYTGRPLTANQITHLGQLARWLHDTYGVPLTYRTGDPREWIDNTGFRGFIAHRAVDYPPDTSLRHGDEITPGEWAAAVGSAPAPTSTGKAQIMMVQDMGNQGAIYVVGVGSGRYLDTPDAVNRLKWFGIPGPHAMDSLHVIQVFQTLGAWKDNAPVLVP